MAKPTSLLKGFERAVATAKPTGKQQIIFDESTTGLALIIRAKGKKSFAVVSRGPEGKQVWKTIGSPPAMSVADARSLAQEAVERIKAGQAPVPKPEPEAPIETFKVISDRFCELWVDRGGRKADGVPLRSAKEVKRHFSKYCLPLHDKPFLEVRRKAVTELLDNIARNSGTGQADRVFDTLSKLFNWYRKYDENYVSPVIPEMKQAGTVRDRARTRILNDDEIRTFWKAADRSGTYGAVLKILLLTGARRDKVRTMRWADIADGVWTIQTEAREKENAGVLRLSAMAMKVIKAQPRKAKNEYVFPARKGDGPIGGFNKTKAAFDKLAPMEPWVVHDLRRTAKSLMARAGVRPDISERVLGHVIRGVEGTYDRYGYADEKGEALEALASLVERILADNQDNVVAMKRG